MSGLFNQVVQKKPLAVSSHGVIVSRGVDPAYPRYEQCVGCLMRKGRAYGIYLQGHELVIGGQVEQLFAVATPARLITTPGRDLPLACCCGEWPDVNFRSSRFKRRIGYPFPVWRKLGLALIRICLQKEDGGLIAFEGQDP